MASVIDALESRGAVYVPGYRPPVYKRGTNLKFYIVDWLARKAVFAVFLFSTSHAFFIFVVFV